MRSKEAIGFDFFQREGDRFLAEGTSDLFEGEELLCRGVLYEVDV